MALPGVREQEGRFAFEVESRGKRKGIAWVWLERFHPRQARVPNPQVLAVRTDQADARNADPLVDTSRVPLGGAPVEPTGNRH